jgi:hypothetical protein
LKIAKRGKGGKRGAYIRGILERGITPEIIVLYQNLSEQEAFAMEKQLIAELGRKDLKTGILLNFTPGGDGPVHSPEVYAAIGRKLQGRKRSEASILRTKESLTGRTRSHDERHNIARGLSGKKHDETRRKNISIGTSEAMIARALHAWKVISDTGCISYFATLDELSAAGLSGLYTTIRTGRQMKRGRFRGWQLFKVHVDELRQHAVLSLP